MSEASEQAAVIQYCDVRHIPIYAVPNGGKRDKAEAAHLKAQGVKAGVPDLCVPVARGGYFGLYIEMKVGTNKATMKQAEWLNMLNKQGYLAVVCRGAHEAMKTIAGYMLKAPSRHSV